jgi:DnaK suppressor protein
LTSRLAEIDGDATTAIEPARRDAVSAPDEDEQPLTEMNQSIASSRNLARRRERSAVEAALHKLERKPDEFGLCERCEEPIATRRLELVPWTRTCVDCTAQVEPPRGGPRRHAGDFG